MMWGRAGRAAIIALCACLADVPAVGQTAPPQPDAPKVKIQLKFPPTKVERRPAPFELINGVIVFRATIQGKEVWAILDNRLESSLIDAGFVKNAGIALGPALGPMRTATGSLPRQLTSVVQIDIPGQVSINAPLSAIDLSFVAKATGRPISLALGKEYFGNLLFLIKNSDHTFQLGPSGTLLNTPSAVTPIALQGDRPKLDITIDGVKFLMTLDLGYNGRVALSKSAWIAAGLDKQPVVERKSSRLEGTIITVPHTIAASVQVGAERFSNVDVSEQPILADDGDGMIGLGILSPFDFALDIKAGKLWLFAKPK